MSIEVDLSAAQHPTMAAGVVLRAGRVALSAGHDDPASVVDGSSGGGHDAPGVERLNGPVGAAGHGGTPVHQVAAPPATISALAAQSV